MSASFHRIFFVRTLKFSLLNILFLTFLSGCGGGGSSSEKANSDTVAPLVTLNGASNLSLLQWDDYIEQGAIAHGLNPDDLIKELNNKLKGGS